jgi:aryl-alcohol dehydrogenase-like predicted oxidoreductase
MRSGEMFEWLRILKKEGKIKRFGASVESMDEALTCLDQEGMASLQIIFNIFRQKPIDTLFARAKSQGVALIIRLPLASGLLSGRFKADSEFPPDDHRNFNRDGQRFNVGETFAGLTLAKGVGLVEKLRAILPANKTLTQSAMRWILDFDAVTTIIPGAKRPEQVKENCSASDLAPLSAETHERLRKLYEQEVVQNLRGPQ